MNEIEIKKEDLQELIYILEQIKLGNNVHFSEKAIRCTKKLCSFFEKSNYNKLEDKDKIALKIEQKLTKDLHDAIDDEEYKSLDPEEITETFSKAYMLAAGKAIITHVIVKDSSDDKVKEISEMIDRFKDCIIEAYIKFESDKDE